MASMLTPSGSLCGGVPEGEEGAKAEEEVTAALAGVVTFGQLHTWWTARLDEVTNQNFCSPYQNGKSPWQNAKSPSQNGKSP